MVTNIAEIALASALNETGMNHAIAKLAKKDEQLALLAKLLANNGSSSLTESVESSETELEDVESSKEEEADSDETSSVASEGKDDEESDSQDSEPEAKPARPTVQRTAMNAAQLSGAGTLSYLEYNTSEAV